MLSLSSPNSDNGNKSLPSSLQQLSLAKEDVDPVDWIVLNRAVAQRYSHSTVRPGCFKPPPKSSLSGDGQTALTWGLRGGAVASIYFFVLLVGHFDLYFIVVHPQTPTSGFVFCHSLSGSCCAGPHTP